MKSKNSKKKIFPKSRKAALEMSVGTIVTIVLLMSVLILGIFLVQRIFSSSTNAIDQVDSQIQSEITKLFSNSEKDLIIYPTSTTIDIKRGDDPAGFAFSVKNNDGANAQDYIYTVSSNGLPSGLCGSLTNEQANSYIIGATGPFTLGGGNSLENPRLVRFSVPDTAPSCSFFYDLNIEGSLGQLEGTQVFVSFK